MTDIAWFNLRKKCGDNVGKIGIYDEEKTYDRWKLIQFYWINLNT